MYWKEILWLLSWPLIIWVNYLLVRIALKGYDRKHPETAAEAEH